MKRLAALAAASLAAVACAGPPASSPKVERPAETTGADPGLRFAELGRCALESGEVVEGCRLGYRTFGTLDAARTNGVLFPTYFTGTSGDVAPTVVDKLVDTKRFFLVVVDALGDGVSSSPSNSSAQPRMRFPRFSVRDMVEAQRRLVTEVLHLPRLHAVAGISMGGMQAFEWGASHPELATRVVSIAGTPRLTSSDMLLWSAEIAGIDGAAAYRGGDYEGHPFLAAPVYIHEMHLFTPAHRASETPPEGFAAWRDAMAKERYFDWNDWKRQAEAMLAHDVGRGRGGLAGVAKRMPPLLAVVAEEDQMVNPAPSLELAKQAGAETLVLRSPCGHAAPTCEAEAVARATRAFLAR